jgi:integrase
MASIRKRGPYQWQAVIRRKGHPTQTETFETKARAEAWASVVESEMVRNVFVDRSALERTTLGDLLTRYGNEVSVKNKSHRTEMVTIRRFLRHHLSGRSLAGLRGVDFTEYTNERLNERAANNSVRLELALLSKVFNTARTAWSIPVTNFISDINNMPRPGTARDRRLVDDEEQRLLAAARMSRAPSLELCIVLAIETGLRSGNIVELHWEKIDFAKNEICVGMTKNGSPITVPLSRAAKNALLAYPGLAPTGRITRFSGCEGLAAAFGVACRRAGITGMTFHDLRHEAASRIAPHVPTVTLAKLMGWKTISMAMRYYNPKGKELAEARLAAESAYTRTVAAESVTQSITG